MRKTIFFHFRFDKDPPLKIEDVKSVSNLCVSFYVLNA